MLGSTLMARSDMQSLLVVDIIMNSPVAGPSKHPMAMGHAVKLPG